MLDRIVRHYAFPRVVDELRADETWPGFMRREGHLGAFFLTLQVHRMIRPCKNNEETMSITSATLQRTFRVRCGSERGTCFTIDLDDRRYLVTARHVAHGIGDRDVIEIWHDGSWKQLDIELVGHGEGDVDVTVMAPRSLFGGGYPIAGYESYNLGEAVYFLGFPFELGSEVGDMNQDFPIPWVKRGIVSAFNKTEGVIYLDGHNNPGFSGGPVVRDSTSGVQILGVLSGYEAERQSVLDVADNEGPYTYDLNTGIVIAYDARYIAQIASKNPIGVSVRQE